MSFQKPNSRKRWILIVLCALVVVIAVGIRFVVQNHVPIKVYYDRGSNELVISPGLLYTLEGYTIQETGEYDGWYEEEVMLPLSKPSDSEYRFRPVLGAHYGVPFGVEEIVVSARSVLSGRIEDERIHIQRYTRREYDEYFIDNSDSRERYDHIYVNRTVNNS